MTKVEELLRARFGIAEDVDEIALNATLEGILARRSIRKFQDKDVPDALLRVLLACAQSAPAKSDLQQYSIIHVADGAKKAALAKLAATPWIETAPVMLVFCGDGRRARRISELRGKPYGQDTLDSFMNAAVDAGLALQAFVIAAEAADWAAARSAKSACRSRRCRSFWNCLPTFFRSRDWRPAGPTSTARSRCACRRLSSCTVIVMTMRIWRPRSTATMRSVMRPFPFRRAAKSTTIFMVRPISTAGRNMSRAAYLALRDARPCAPSCRPVASRWINQSLGSGGNAPVRRSTVTIVGVAIITRM